MLGLRLRTKIALIHSGFFDHAVPSKNGDEEVPPQLWGNQSFQLKIKECLVLENNAQNVLCRFREQNTYYAMHLYIRELNHLNAVNAKEDLVDRTHYIDTRKYT
jgi:hypothetical protein